MVQDVKRGEAFTAENVRSIRPGQGLHPRHLEEVLGKRAARDTERGTPLSWELVIRFMRIREPSAEAGRVSVPGEFGISTRQGERRSLCGYLPWGFASGYKVTDPDQDGGW